MPHGLRVEGQEGNDWNSWMDGRHWKTYPSLSQLCLAGVKGDVGGCVVGCQRKRGRHERHSNMLWSAEDMEGQPAKINK